MAVQITGALLMKRRPTGGAAGAPTTLRSGEPAFNEADNTLYIGVGDNGEGLATSVVAIGGSGVFVTKQALEEALENTGAGDMMKSRYDANDDGVVDKADLANRVPWGGIQSRPETFPPSAHSHDVATDTTPGFMSAEDKLKLTNLPANANNYVHPAGDGNRHVPATSAANTGKFLKSGASAGAASSWETLSKSDVGLGNVSNLSPADMPVSTAQQEAIDEKAALNSPAFTGVPTAPTAAPNVSNKQIATTEFVVNRIQEIIGAAPEALDTLIELAEAIGNDPDFAGTITTMVAGKLAKTANLSDLASASVARQNLGLGSLATQDANAVNLTGGTISNVVIEGGTF